MKTTLRISIQAKLDLSRAGAAGADDPKFVGDFELALRAAVEAVAAERGIDVECVGPLDEATVTPLADGEPLEGSIYQAAHDRLRRVVAAHLASEAVGEDVSPAMRAEMAAGAALRAAGLEPEIPPYAEDYGENMWCVLRFRSTSSEPDCPEGRALLAAARLALGDTARVEQEGGGWTDGERSTFELVVRAPRRDYKVTDTRTDEDAGVYTASSAEDACRLAVAELAAPWADNAPSIEDLEAAPSDMRAAYLALFPSHAAAVEFEDQCLSIGNELLPACARAVRDQHTASLEYWRWLIEQATSVDDAASSTITYRIAPASDPADFYRAGFDGNKFDDREAAARAITGLRALGGEWDIDWIIVED